MGQRGLWVVLAASAASVAAHAADTAARPSFVLPGDRILVQSAWDALSLYDLDGAEIRRFELGARVVAAAVSPDGARLAAAAKTGRVRIWRIDDGECTAGLLLRA